jgi:hypothetical protein
MQLAQLLAPPEWCQTAGQANVLHLYDMCSHYRVAPYELVPISKCHVAHYASTLPYATIPKESGIHYCRVEDALLVALAWHELLAPKALRQPCSC